MNGSFNVHLIVAFNVMLKIVIDPIQFLDVSKKKVLTLKAKKVINHPSI